MEHLTFKQYLESKAELREAIKQTPISIVEYHVKKYCSLSVGETKQDSSVVSLKPKHRLVVEWHYDNIDNPSIESVKVIDSELQEDNYSVYWSGAKFQKWLMRHTKQG